MSKLSDAEFATDHTPYSVDRPLMIRCSCGEDHSPAEHGSLATLATRDADDGAANFVEASLMKALFPKDNVRRGFLKAVGANTARAAIASLATTGSS